MLGENAADVFSLLFPKLRAGEKSYYQSLCSKDNAVL